MQENMRLLLYVAEWTVQSNRQMRRTIRELAGTGENYLILGSSKDRAIASQKNVEAIELSLET